MHPDRKKFFAAILAGSLLFLLLSASAAFGVPILPDPPYEIVDDATGGDCATIGAWDNASKTCTLNQDVNVSAFPENAFNIISNGITLNGNGHTVTGSSLHYGVTFAPSLSNITVENFKFTTFFFGVQTNAGTNITIQNNEMSDCSTCIFVLNSIGNHVIGNIIATNNQFTGIGIALDGSTSTEVKDNRISGATSGIELYNADSSIVTSNSSLQDTNWGFRVSNGSDNNDFYNNTVIGDQENGAPIAISLDNSSNNDFYNNNILNHSTQALVTGGSGNTFNQPAPIGGNYWDNHATAAQGCTNIDNDRFCDAPYAVGGATDSLPLARRGYYFTWYDQVSAGALNWILMANPIDATTYPLEDAWIDLSIAGDPKALPSSAAGGLPGQVVPLSSITPSYPGVINGPVEVGYHARMRQMVSQRVLWGDSLEEITGTDATNLSSHYYWTWYDMATPGFANWLLVANPSANEIVTVSVDFKDILTDLPVSESHVIVPGGTWNTTYPGKIGGPVEVKAWLLGSSWPAGRRDVIASQRVLSNFGAAFNEVPGISEAYLTDHYEWTWYDMLSPGAQNWILVSNPGGSPVTYTIKIDGNPMAGYENRALAAGATEFPTFPGVRGGPVEVIAVGGNIIASQRSLWGPSFEEVPGYPYTQLTTNYYWTWYDQVSPGVTNWVLVANPTNPDDPSPYAAGFQIKIGDTLMDLDDDIAGQQGGFLYPGDIKTYTFPGTINGPVQVIADNNVISSQRVLWKGYFNEVMGTDLD